MSSGSGWHLTAGSRVKPKPGRTCSARRAHRFAQMPSPRGSPACVWCGIVHVLWNVAKDRTRRSQQLLDARTGHDRTPFAGSRGGRRRVGLVSGLAPCRGARDLGYPLLAWVAATRLRGMAWDFAGLVQTSGWGIGFPSWAHGSRARSSLAFNSRSGVPQPASG